VDAVTGTYTALRSLLASQLYPQLRSVYEAMCTRDPYRLDAPSVARRRLRNVCLAWLVASGQPKARALALEQYHAADNMTDAHGALLALNDHDGLERDEALAHFHARWQRQPLILDKWLSLQATARRDNLVGTVRTLLQGPEFDPRNPNRVRALLGAFAHRNFAGFHDASGAGYELVAEQVAILDRLNPQVAARLVTAFTRWRRFAGTRRELMRKRLEGLSAVSGLSNDVYEIVSKSLNPG
jgi:aminopeptidase N